MTKFGKRWLAVGLVVLLAGTGYYAWTWVKLRPLPLLLFAEAESQRSRCGADVR